MHGPPLIGWLLTALCGAVAIHCLSLTRSGPPARRRAAGGEALMGLGMVVMAVPVAAVSAQTWLPAAFAVLFGLSCAVSLVLAAAGLRNGTPGWYHGHHAVSSAAMVHMGLAMAAATGQEAHAVGAGHTAHAAHAGQGAAQEPGGLPLLTGALLAYFALYALWTGLRLAPMPAGVRAAVPAGGPRAIAAGDPGGPSRHPCRAGGRGPAVREARRTAEEDGCNRSGASGPAAACRLVMAMSMIAMLTAL